MVRHFWWSGLHCVLIVLLWCPQLLAADTTTGVFYLRNNTETPIDVWVDFEYAGWLGPTQIVRLEKTKNSCHSSGERFNQDAVLNLSTRGRHSYSAQIRIPEDSLSLKKKEKPAIWFGKGDSGLSVDEADYQKSLSLHKSVEKPKWHPGKAFVVRSNFVPRAAIDLLTGTYAAINDSREHIRITADSSAEIWTDGSTEHSRIYRGKTFYTGWKGVQFSDGCFADSIGISKMEDKLWYRNVEYRQTAH